MNKNELNRREKKPLFHFWHSTFCYSTTQNKDKNNVRYSISFPLCSLYFKTSLPKIFSVLIFLFHLLSVFMYFVFFSKESTQIIMLHWRQNRARKIFFFQNEYFVFFLLLFRIRTVRTVNIPCVYILFDFTIVHIKSMCFTVSHFRSLCVHKMKWCFRLKGSR